jgi:hypothetical protein
MFVYEKFTTFADHPKARDTYPQQLVFITRSVTFQPHVWSFVYFLNFLECGLSGPEQQYFA